MNDRTTEAAEHSTTGSQGQPSVIPPKRRHFVLKTAYAAAKEMDMEQMPALCGVWVWTEDKGPYRERPHCRECLAMAFELGELG